MLGCPVTMTAELISVMSLAVMAFCEQRAYPLQGPEIRGQQRPDCERAARGRVVRRNRQTVNHRTRRRAEPQEHDERLC